LPAVVEAGTILEKLVIRRPRRLTTHQEEAEMATELALVVRRLFDDLDSLNFEAVRGYFTTDAQAVEEIARRWMRDSGESADYFAHLKPILSDVKSQLHDVHEVTWGDTGLVTLWLEQTYVLEGEAQQVSAPTTIVLRREHGTWKIALAHSVPMPPEP
jgi:ketosteroid isomerase-like protein